MRRAWVLMLMAAAALLAGCAGLPSLDGRRATVAITDTAHTALGRAALHRTTAQPGLTGVHALPDPRDALAARMLLARHAEASIDAQYFLWAGDQVGTLMFAEMWAAAVRGVRVRLLLDDFNTRGLDPMIAALDAHPNIEIRLYNPFVERDARALDYLADFARVNRRMHNKAFIVDTQLCVVGGRNIANEYFDAGIGVGFIDFDMIAVGVVVPDVAREFDRFWNSASAYPAAAFVGAAPADPAGWLEARFQAARDDPGTAIYREAVRTTPLVQAVAEGRIEYDWTNVRVVYDEPAKTLATDDREDLLLFPTLTRVFGKPSRSVDLISPYFVPGADGGAMIEDLVRRGVRVRILTNSLAATDEAVVHAGYSRYREKLVRAGATLYEIKPNAVRDARGRGWFGRSSAAALHAKTFGVDGSRLFVGSFNFDQRSYRLNTEMGLIIDSALHVQTLREFFDLQVPQLAYEVRPAPGADGLIWVERHVNGEHKTTYDVDPQTTWALRFGIGIMSILPIEWLL